MQGKIHNDRTFHENILLISTRGLEMTYKHTTDSRCSTWEEFCNVIPELFSCRNRCCFRAALNDVATIGIRKIIFFGGDLVENQVVVKPATPSKPHGT